MLIINKNSKILISLLITVLLFTIPSIVGFALASNTVEPEPQLRPDDIVTATVSFKDLKNLNELQKNYKNKKILQIHHIYAGQNNTFTGGYVLSEDKNFEQQLEDYRDSQIYVIKNMINDLTKAIANPDYNEDKREAALILLEDLKQRLNQIQQNPNNSLQVYGIVIRDTVKNLEKLKSNNDIAYIEIAKNPKRPPMPVCASNILD